MTGDLLTAQKAGKATEEAILSVKCLMTLSAILIKEAGIIRNRTGMDLGKVGNSCKDN